MDVFEESSNDSSLAIYWLAALENKLFTVLPNAADPERLFSEMGRTVSPSRAKLSDESLKSLIVISADVRAREAAKLVKDDVESISIDKSKTAKRFSDKYAAILKLREFTSSDVAMNSLSGAEEEPPAESNYITNFNNQENAVKSREESTGSMKDSDDECASQHNQDDFEAKGFEKFFDTFGEDFSVDLSLLGEPASAQNSSDPTSNGTREEEERRRSLDLFKLGQLPDFNDKNVPQEKLWGYRAEKLSLEELFDETLIGELPPLTKIGILQ